MQPRVSVSQFHWFACLERNGHTLTKSTPLDKYLSRPDDQHCSWYQFICKQGKVPVISGTNMYASWPLNEDYCRSMLLLHWPTWRKLSDIKDEDMSRTSAFDIFIITDTCPCFVKADVDRAKRKQSAHMDKEDEHQISEDEEDPENKPPWMQLLQPNPNFNTDPDILFDDGGPESDWGHHSRNYPAGFGLKWLGQLDRDMSHRKYLTGQITLAQLNEEQQFAFNIVLNTMLQYQKDPSSVHPLRLIITGTPGSGKSFLIKSLVSALTQVFDNDKVVQVVCPTGNSANLISRRTIHDFFRLPVRNKAHKEMTPPNSPVCEMLQQKLL